jgi:hypothetical protein
MEYNLEQHQQEVKNILASLDININYDDQFCVSKEASSEALARLFWIVVMLLHDYPSHDDWLVAVQEAVRDKRAECDPSPTSNTIN